MPLGSFGTRPDNHDIFDITKVEDEDVVDADVDEDCQQVFVTDVAEDVCVSVEIIVCIFFDSVNEGIKVAKMVSVSLVTDGMPTVNFNHIVATRILVNQVWEVLRGDISKADTKENGIGHETVTVRNREREQSVQVIV